VASIGAGTALVGWVVDSTKRVDCPNGAVEFIPIQTVGLVASAVLQVAAVVALVVTLRWRTRGPAISWVVVPGCWNF
jgi:hypothetical protein